MEIALEKAADALTVGAANDEVNRRGLNEVKRGRLIRAGADAIVGDFTELSELKKLFGLMREDVSHAEKV